MFYECGETILPFIVKKLNFLKLFHTWAIEYWEKFVKTTDKVRRINGLGFTYLKSIHFQRLIEILYVED